MFLHRVFGVVSKAGMMATTRVFCTRCSAGITLVDGVKSPEICPECKSPCWNVAVNPATPFVLTKNDRDFLRKKGIAAPEPEPELDDCA